MLGKEFDFFRSVPDSESRLLLDREPDEAYLTQDDNQQYAVYFPDGGSVQLDLSKAKGSFTVKWLDIDNSRWRDSQKIERNQHVELTPPGKGGWAALLKAAR